MEGSYDRYYILFFFLLYAILNLQLLFSERDDSDKASRHRENFKRANASLSRATFNETTWGFPEPFRHYIDEVIDARLIVKAGGRFYQQPFGLVRGDWLKGSTKPEATVHGLEEQSPDLAWRRAVNTSRRGVMHLDLKRDLTDAPAMNATFGFVYGRLSLYSDIALNESKSLLLEGLHVVSNGSIYLHGYSSASEYDPSNLLGILPADLFSKAKEGLERHLNQSLGLFENMTDPSLNASCWVQMVAQLMPFAPKYSREEILALEAELEKPQGVSTIPAMPLHFNTFVYSPNCPDVAVYSSVVGDKEEVLIGKVVLCAGMAAGLGLAEALLMIAQTEYSATHSMVCKVSMGSLLLHMAVDGYMLLVHIYAAIAVLPARLPLLSSAFFFLVTLGLYEVKYLRLLVRVQRPETSHLRNGRALAIYHLLFYFLMLGGLMLVFQTLFSRGKLQLAMIRTFFFGLYSFWIPQIWRNITRGTSKGLSPTYTVGISATKLAIPLYLFAYPGNVLGLSTETHSWVWYLVAYVAAQILILFSQDWLGPRWLVPAFLLPPTYNYHPILARTNEEEPLDPSHKDCAICMLSLLEPDSSDPSTPLLHPQTTTYRSSATMSLARFSSSRGLMVTPCQHYFHTSCLDQWMKIKLECPVCRTPLPPN
ncbi:hypothetical protein L0F63_005597 [Massospora cicadina]|nr:hypothetical protein L0F63_005597 [Massospora cicadina]